MSTPAERAAVLRQIHAETARANQAATETRHMPGSGTSIFKRTTYWEQRAEAAFTELDAIAYEWRVACGRAGDRPDEDPDVIRLGAERDAAHREYERCRNLRDDALGELNSLYDIVRGG